MAAVTEETREARRARLDREEKAARRAGMADAMAPGALAALLAAQAPEGWSATHGEGWTDSGFDVHTEGFGAATHHVLFEQGQCKVVLNITAVPRRRGGFDANYARQHAYRGCSVEGHTWCGTMPYTRIGVDSHSSALRAARTSCYGDNEATELPALLASQLARVAATLERRKTAVAVPGLPFTVQPEWFTRSAATLAEGRCVRLTPSGFGTGYTILPPGSRRSRYAKRADAALEAKLGTAPLYVETFDHD